MFQRLNLKTCNFSPLKLKSRFLPKSIVSNVKFKFRSQPKFLPQIRSPITFWVQKYHNIISIWRNPSITRALLPKLFIQNHTKLPITGKRKSKTENLNRNSFRLFSILLVIAVKKSTFQRSYLKPNWKQTKKNHIAQSDQKPYSHKLPKALTNNRKKTY